MVLLYICIINKSTGSIFYPMKTVTFETKCWEGDWDCIINKDAYQIKINDFYGYNFTEKNLIINNVTDSKTVCLAADKLKEAGIIDNWYLVSEYEKDVLDYFEITRDSFLWKEVGGDGYIYSIAELTGIFLSKCDYIMHLSSDSRICPWVPKTDSAWLNKAIDLMETNPNVIICIPNWKNTNYNEVLQQSEKLNLSHLEDNNWVYTKSFCDQCYFIKKDLFKKQIYNTYHKDSSCYVYYGGNSFEKRLFSFLKNNPPLMTAVSKHSWYHHPIYF